MEEQRPVINKTNGKRNRNAGHSLERSVADEFRQLGFQHTVTSRVESKRRDDAKVDIMNKDEQENGRLPYNIQCKNCSTSMAYPKLLAEMPKGPELNVVLHNQTVKSDGGRFITKGQFALMDKSSFYTMVSQIERLKAGFAILNNYFDCIPPEDQEQINQSLAELGL